MAKLTPKPGVTIRSDGPPITATLHFDPSPHPTEPPDDVAIMGGEFVRVPDGLTASEARHRLETWDAMLAALRYAHEQMSNDGGGGVSPLADAIAASENRP